MAEQSGNHGANTPSPTAEIRVGGTPESKPTDPGMVCLECGTELTYTGRGRRPRYCSSSCRHRAWERRRAAADGVVATQIVELPALPMEPTYTRSGVIEWLRDKPRRLADVAGALPDGEEAARMLDTARQRLRDHGVRTEREQLVESQARQNLSLMRTERDEMRQEVARLREENLRLRDVLERSRETAHRATSSGSSGASNPGRRASPDGQGEALFTTARARGTAAGTSTGAPPLRVGFKAMEMGGRTFHVPEGWSRAQARKWCRTHPDEAVG